MLQVSSQDIDRFRSILVSQVKRTFPQYNCAKFLMNPSSVSDETPGHPLIFSSTPDGDYVLEESVDSLR